MFFKCVVDDQTFIFFKCVMGDHTFIFFKCVMGDHVFIFFKWVMGDHTNGNVMDGACGTFGGEEKCALAFGCKT